MLNDLDRFHLVIDVIDRVPGLGARRRAPAPAAWSTGAWSAAPTRARTARTRPRSATGPGRREAAAARPAPASAASDAADPRRQRGLEQPQAAGPRRRRRRRGRRADLPAPRGAADAAAVAEAIGGLRRDRRGRPPDRPRRDALPRARCASTTRSRRDLRALTDLAPLHQPKSLAALGGREGRPARTCPRWPASTRPSTPTMPAAATTYALPREWRKRWALRRYGFHGLSHAYASRRAAELLGRPVEELRIVTCHLGAGASLAAVRGGRSVDTTMGFTPLEGLVMATRSGSVDPGLVLWLEEHVRHAAGRAGRDARAPLRAPGPGRHAPTCARSWPPRPAGDETATLAVDVYLHRLRAVGRGDGRRPRRPRRARLHRRRRRERAGHPRAARGRPRLPRRRRSTRPPTTRRATTRRSACPARPCGRSSSRPARTSRSCARSVQSWPAGARPVTGDQSAGMSGSERPTSCRPTSSPRRRSIARPSACDRWARSTTPRTTPPGPRAWPTSRPRPASTVAGRTR